jgi:hypothetical protein
MMPTQNASADQMALKMHVNAGPTLQSVISAQHGDRIWRHWAWPMPCWAQTAFTDAWH